MRKALHKLDKKQKKSGGKGGGDEDGDGEEEEGEDEEDEEDEEEVAEPPKKKSNSKEKEKDKSKDKDKGKDKSKGGSGGGGDAGKKRKRDEATADSSAGATAATQLRLSATGARILDERRPLKEQAIDAILVRWQYADHLAWAPLEKGPPEFSGFMMLPGFPGCFIGTDDNVLGELEDRRPAEPRPSANYLSSLPTKTLKELWRSALVRQRSALIAAEGEGTMLAKALTEELSVVDAIDAARADEQWKRPVATGKAGPKAGPAGTTPAASSSSSAKASAAVEEDADEDEGESD
jgi:hypothetical protein